MCTNADHLTNINIAPLSDSIALQAAPAADLVLIPCRPVILDLEANGVSLNLEGASSTPAVTLLNAVASSGSEADEAAEAIIELGAQASVAQYIHRVAFSRALIMGQTALEYEPHAKAAQEVKSLHRCICAQLSFVTGSQRNKRL
jgi:chromosome partitioning protein